MKSKGLSTAKLFMQLPCNCFTSQKQLSAFREGRNEPNIDCIRGLSKFFNLSIEDFCYTDLISVGAK